MSEINWHEYITSDPKILFGKPVIKGTRVPVDLILEKLGKGETFPKLLKSYPRVTEKALYACLIFAAEAVKNEVVVAAAA
ncbi:MAG: DUF433 domain-containing protein [Bacteroidetes bacterium]|nr:DUF433 domain-containing protein [Bacteroidota bacterium]